MRIRLILLTLIFYCFGYSQAWMGNQLGLNKDVPKPWTPIAVKQSGKETVVSCWGRDYVFESGFVLKQIFINKESLLATPISLSYGGRNEWTPVSSKILYQSEEKVTLQLLAKSAQNNLITNTTTIEIYYDGLLFIKTGIKSAKILNDEVSFRISMPQNTAQHLYRWVNSKITDTPWWYSDKFPKLNTTDYIPYFWIGNKDSGLFWISETPNQWASYRKKNAIVFKNHVSNNIAELNIAGKTEIQTKEWSIEFGLQATPVKPRDEDWRSWQFWGVKESNIMLVWPQIGTKYDAKHFAYPEAKDLNSFKEYVNELKGNKKRKVLLYNALTSFSTATPEWKLFSERWNVDAMSDQSPIVFQYGGKYPRINNTDKAFQDFIVWKSHRFMKETATNGFYLDISMIADLNHYKEIQKIGKEIQKMPYYPFMSYRKLFERYYKMVKNEDESNMIIVNSSARISPPFISFADAIVDGEQFKENIAKVKDDYLTVSNLSEFQHIFSGKPLGIPIIFLPEFTEQNYKIAGPSRYLAGLLMLHDALVWPMFSATIAWSERYNILMDFPGIKTSDFIPYYDKAPVLTSNSNNILTSVYKNKKGDYLCIVVNTSSNKMRTRLLLPNQKLSDFRLVNKVARSVPRMSNNKISFDLNGKDFSAFYLIKI